MKVSKEKAAENRELILGAAARLFRERGLSGVGIDEVTAVAGLTHGSVYSQFGSKERLVCEAMNYGFEANAVHPSAEATLSEIISNYLSETHRDKLGRGCMVAALGSEMPRQARSVREIFTQRIKKRVQRLSTKLAKRGKQSREDQALALFASMVGTLVLARAVDDPELSSRILGASRKRILEDFKEQAPVRGETLQ